MGMGMGSQLGAYLEIGPHAHIQVIYPKSAVTGASLSQKNARRPSLWEWEQNCFDQFVPFTGKQGFVGASGPICI